MADWGAVPVSSGIHWILDACGAPFQDVRV